MSEKWRGDSDDLVDGRRFSSVAKRWLLSSLSRRVRVVQGFADGTFSEDLIPHMVRWYQERWEDFVDWKPYGEFGRGLRSGRWVFCETDFCEQWQAAKQYATERVAEKQAAREAARYASLDEWLEAERRGALEGKGVKGGKMLGLTLTEAERTKRAIAAIHRYYRWPRNCRTCGESFRPEKNRSSQLKRCLACRTATRTKATDNAVAVAEPARSKHGEAAAPRPEVEQSAAPTRPFADAADAMQASADLLKQAIAAQHKVTEILKNRRRDEQRKRGGRDQ